MSYADAYSSAANTYFDATASDSPTGWELVKVIPDNSFTTITIDVRNIIACIGDGVSTCYANFSEAVDPDAEAPEGQ